MTYKIEIHEKLKKNFAKIKKKDPIQAEIIKRKIKEIQENPEIGKPLTANRTGQRRVHIRHFVLIYAILEEENVIRLLDYEHHDKVYD